MKIKDGFVIRTVAGNCVAAATGEASKTFNGIITLNETGEMLFKMLEKDVTQEQLVKEMLDKFDIDEKTAQKDVDSFIKKLKEAKILE